MDPWLVVWAGYPRISEDPNDERSGVDRQRTDIIAGVRARGGDPEKIVWYEENDTSAYKRKRIKKTDPLGNEYWGERVIRPVWHQMLADLRSGKVQAAMVWDIDRLARDPNDLEDAIEHVVYYKRRIESTAGSLDLMTSDGQAMARVMVAMGNKSSADTGRRVKRAHLELAKAGTPVGGHRPFGWKVDKTSLEPTEAALVRSAVDDLLQGRSVRSVLSEWQERGITTTTGKAWDHRKLQQYLKNPRLKGVRTYKREILLDDEGNPVVGKWEPLLDAETFDRLQLLFQRAENRGRIPQKTKRHYLLTGTVRCGVCSAVMYGNRYAEGRHYYVCKDNGHYNSISGNGTDTLVEKFVLAKLANEELEPEKKPKVYPREQELKDTKDNIDKLMGAFLDGTLSETVVFPRVKALEVSYEEIKKDRAQWLKETTGPVLKKLSKDEWDALDTDEQRAHVEKLLDAVLVKPPRRPGGRNRYDRWRVVPVPREG